MSYFKFKARPSKTTERQKLVRKLDDEFSIYVRLVDCDEDGMVACLTCGDKHHWTDIDCGHFMPRANMATRWELKATGPQCRLCNSTVDGRRFDFAIALDNKHGAGTSSKMEILSRTERHFSETELKGMIDELRKEIKAIKIEKEMV